MENTKGLSVTTQGQDLGIISCLKDKNYSDIFKNNFMFDDV